MNSCEPRGIFTLSSFFYLTACYLDIKRGGLNPVNWVNAAAVLCLLQIKLAKIQPQACRESQYDSHNFQSLATCTYSSDNPNVLEELSLLFEDHEILALGTQMLN